MDATNYRCCDTLAEISGMPRLAGHHALCPRFSLSVIEERAAKPTYPVAGTDMMEAHADRAVLLAALRERTAQVKAPHNLRTENDYLHNALLATQRRRDEAEREGVDLRARLASYNETLAMTRELGAEVQRLRSIVEEVAKCDPVVSVDGGEICGLCRRSAPEDCGVDHRPDCLSERAKAALRPAGTLASIPADECE